MLGHTWESAAGDVCGKVERERVILPDRLYTLQEAAELLQVSPRTVLNLVRRGTVRAVRLGDLWRFWGRDLLRIGADSADAVNLPL